MIRSIVLSAIAATILLAAGPGRAALPVGAHAPDFTTQATLAGKPFSFHLADALRKGPVVLYFYPAAFTTGCTIEAHDFAEATAAFQAMGATESAFRAMISRRSTASRYPSAAANSPRPMRSSSRHIR